MGISISLAPRETLPVLDVPPQAQLTNISITSVLMILRIKHSFILSKSLVFYQLSIGLYQTTEIEKLKTIITICLWASAQDRDQYTSVLKMEEHCIKQWFSNSLWCMAVPAAVTDTLSILYEERVSMWVHVCVLAPMCESVRHTSSGYILILVADNNYCKVDFVLNQKNLLTSFFLKTDLEFFLFF